jgi:hypothetical protein
MKWMLPSNPDVDVYFTTTTTGVFYFSAGKRNDKHAPRTGFRGFEALQKWML